MINRFFKYIPIVILFACSNEPVINSIGDLDRALKTESQNFQIDPTKDTIIKCAEGTILFIPANSLVSQTDLAINGTIDLNITEAQSITSIIGNNLSTLSGDKLIETNGMIRLIAKSGADTLKVSIDKSIVVLFPKRNNTDFNLFYSKKDSLNRLNWIVDNTDNIKPDSALSNVPLGNDTSLILKYVTKTGGIYSESMFNKFDHTFTWKLNDKDSSIFNHIENLFYREKYLSEYFIKNNINLRLEIYLNPKGKIIKIDFEDTTMYKKEISNLLLQLPSFDPISMKRENVSDPYSLYIGASTKLNKEKYLQKFNSKYQKYRDKAIEKIDKADLNYFIYSITKLDWINCDRFPIIEGEAGDFIVNAKTTNESKVYLLFKDIKSAIQATPVGNTFLVRNVPAGQNIKIVAISYADKKPLVAIENIKVENRNVTMKNYKPFSLDELKQELK